MKPTILICLIALVFLNTADAQIVFRPTSTPYNLLGAYSSQKTSVMNTQGNVAAITQIRNFSAGVFTERRFMLKELSYHKAAFIFPTKGGNFGLQVNYFGNTDFNQIKYGLSYGIALAKQVFIGTQINYNTVKIAKYGSDGVPDYALGMLFKLTKNFQAGFQVLNPVGVKYGATKTEVLPSVYTLGLGYDVSKQLVVSMEIEKEADYPININAGIKYFPVPQFSFQLGATTYTSIIYGGFGFHSKKFAFQIFSSYHPVLGFSPGAQIEFLLSKTDDE